MKTPISPLSQPKSKKQGISPQAQKVLEAKHQEAKEFAEKYQLVAKLSKLREKQ